MMRTLVTGLWICLVTLGSCYAAAYWRADAKPKQSEEYFPGLEYKKLRPITVPMVADGAVQGYVMLILVYTADAKTLRDLPVPPDSFIMDEAFRAVYADERLDFRKLQKPDLTGLITAVKASVNRRLGSELVNDILIESVNFVSRADLRNGDMK